MSLIGNLIITVALILDFVLGVYTWVIITAAVINWVSPDPYNLIVRFLRTVTEPAFRPIRRLLGYRLGHIDISPLLVILVIIFTQLFLLKSLIKLGYKLGGG